MIPQHRLSTRPVPGPFLDPDDNPFDPLIDYEYGGVALRDASQGLRVKVWTFRLTGNNVTAEAEDVSPTTLFTRTGITHIAGCFDQNMNPCIAFVQDGNLILWWFDATVSAQVFTPFSGEQPRVCMDDKRATQSQANDIIFSYLRAGDLYFREQRDRFTVERFLAAIPPDFTFTKMGMNTVNRLQFQFDPPEAP